MIIRIYPSESPEGAMRAQAGHGTPKGWNPCKGHSVYGMSAEGATDYVLSPLRGCFSPLPLAGIPPLRGSMRTIADNHYKQ